MQVTESLLHDTKIDEQTRQWLLWGPVGAGLGGQPKSASSLQLPEGSPDAGDAMTSPKRTLSMPLMRLDGSGQRRRVVAACPSDLAVELTASPDTSAADRSPLMPHTRSADDVRRLWLRSDQLRKPPQSPRKVGFAPLPPVPAREALESVDGDDATGAPSVADDGGECVRVRRVDTSDSLDFPPHDSSGQAAASLAGPTACVCSDSMTRDPRAAAGEFAAVVPAVSAPLCNAGIRARVRVLAGAVQHKHSTNVRPEVDPASFGSFSVPCCRADSIVSQQVGHAAVAPCCRGAHSASWLSVVSVVASRRRSSTPTSLSWRADVAGRCCQSA
jgi:hypothetical protein